MEAKQEGEESDEENKPGKGPKKFNLASLDQDEPKKGKKGKGKEG